MNAAENVIGGVIIGGREAYWQVADIVKPEDFSDRRLSKIFIAIAEMAKSTVDIDVVTVADEMGRRGEAAYQDFVLEIAVNTASYANIRSYAEIVASDALSRRFKAICAEGARSGDMATTQSDITALLTSQPSHALPASDAVKRMWADVMERYDAGDEMRGLKTGFPEIDELTGGLQPGRVYGIGARAKMGKTILAMNICTNVACPPLDSTGHPKWEAKSVAIWSLEMADTELAQRLVCSISGVESIYFDRPALFDRDEGVLAKLNSASARLRDSPMTISERTDVTIEQIEAQARQMKAQGKLDLLCIDYLGLLRLPKTDRHDLAIAHITRRVKIIAKELRIPIILVFQLSRGNEKSAAQVRPPRPSDARDSGAIEQDLDAMFLLHRPSYYDKTAKRGLRLDLAIQRNGPTGVMELEDQLHCCRFLPTGRPWVDATGANGSYDDL